MYVRDIRAFFLYKYNLEEIELKPQEILSCLSGKKQLLRVQHNAGFKKFRSRDTNPENQPLRRPETVKEDTSKSLRMLAQELELSPMTISRHRPSIGKAKKLETWVPHEPSANNKN